MGATSLLLFSYPWDGLSHSSETWPLEMPSSQLLPMPANVLTALGTPQSKVVFYSTLMDHIPSFDTWLL